MNLIEYQRNSKSLFTGKSRAWENGIKNMIHLNAKGMLISNTGELMKR